MFLVLLAPLSWTRAGPEADGAPPAPVTDPVSVAWEKACVVHRFSPETGEWSTSTGPRSVLPLKVIPVVGPHAVAALDPPRGCSGWLFDLHTERWTAIPRSPVISQRAGMDPTTAAFVGDRLVVWGQIFRPAGDQPQGAVLDTKSMTWRPMPNAPVVPRYRCVTAVIGDRLLLWGGYGPLAPDRIGPLGDGAVYDAVKDVWDTIPESPVPGPRYGCAALAWNGRMVLVGGRGPGGFFDEGVIYDPDARTWEKMKAAPVRVGENAAYAVHGDKLFVWSGKAAGGGMSKEGIVYDLRARKWEKLPEAPIPPRLLAFARAHPAGVTVWGGWLSDGTPPQFLTDGATYDFNQRRWQPIAPMPGEVPYELHPGW
jgi:hypothetical protein